MQASIQQAAQLQATYPRMRPRDRHGVAGTPKMHSVAIAAGGTPLNTANKLCACVRECVRVFRTMAIHRACGIMCAGFGKGNGKRIRTS